MGLKVHKDELNCSQIESLLDSEIQENESLIASINSFINETTTTLTGEAYNAARAEMQAYVKILNQRKTAATALKSAISSSTSSLSGYMGEYDYLDDSDLEILNSEIASIEASYESIKAGYYQRYNKNFITRIYLNWVVSRANKQCAAQIAPIQREIEKIKGLAGADSSAYSQLVTADSSNSTYKTAITSK